MAVNKGNYLLLDCEDFGKFLKITTKILDLGAIELILKRGIVYFCAFYGKSWVEQKKSSAEGHLGLYHTLMQVKLH